jgi:osmotically-inducible protein OsmY
MMEIHAALAMELSDEGIRELVTRTLDRELPAARDEIKVAVADGWITLTGQLRGQHQKVQAERIVRAVPGVRGVINSILLEGSLGPIALRKSNGLSSTRPTNLRRSASHWR